MRERREIDQVSQELGKLQGQYTSLQGAIDKAAGDVGRLAHDFAELKEESAERRGILEQLLGEVRQLGQAVAHLNDVDRKLLEVGLRGDDAKSHRQDQTFLRRLRRLVEFIGRHAGKAIVAGVVAGLVTLALGNYPAAAKLLAAILEHLSE